MDKIIDLMVARSEQNKRLFYSFAIIFVCLLVVGCKDIDKKKTGEANMSEDLFYDFYLFLKSPRATEKHDLSEVIKIVYTDSNSSTGNTIALDLEKNHILKDPWMSSHGINSMGEYKQIDDMEKVIDILEKYNVQEWKEDYSFEDPSTYEDGYGWNLYLQFQDGTVERHKGSGTLKKNIIPEQFSEFFNELNKFHNLQSLSPNGLES